MLHAQESHAGGEASIVGIGGEERVEALLGVVEVVRVERSKCGALLGRARDAVVHLRQPGFAQLEALLNLLILRMGLEILAQFLGRCGIRGVPDERLTIGSLQRRDRWCARGGCGCLQRGCARRR